MHSVLGNLTKGIHHDSGDTHHSASPMGLWLMLASASSATQSGTQTRQQVENTLGMPVECSVTALNELLGREYGFTATSPYKVTQQFKEGHINYDEMVEQLSVWPYIDVDPATQEGERDPEMILASIPGTFEELCDAIDDGLLTEDEFTDVYIAYIKAYENKNSLSPLTFPTALWTRGNIPLQLDHWKQKNGITSTDDESMKAFYDWRNTLPGLDIGAIPSKKWIDNWSSERTSNRIENINLDIRDEDFSALVQVVAPELSWEEPFTLIENDYLGRSFSSAKTILKSDPTHEVFIVDTQYGEMGVHKATAKNGVSVYSVIADEMIEPEIVISEAHRIASTFNNDVATPVKDLLSEKRLSELYDVLLVEKSAPHSVAYLPSWSTSTHHSNLQDANIGLGEVVEAIAQLAGIPAGQRHGVIQQDISIRYDVQGINKAPLDSTNAKVNDRMMSSLEMDHLQLAIRFDRPYAVVAMVDDVSLWSNTPLFSSWVKEAL